MNETRYMISDTSRQLKVEPHVLRYWEEELDMKIKRNEMGHRYYTADDIRVLHAVRELKDQGFQLKAIKQVLPEIYANKDFNWKALLDQRELLNQTASVMENGLASEKHVAEKDTENIHTRQEGGAGSAKVIKMRQALVNVSNQTPADTMSAELKMEQFQEIMTRIIGKALEANNRSLTGAISNEVSDKVSERVIKQMDYVMRENEEREEERFRKLDEAIRIRQKANAEAAATAEENRRKKKKKLFGKKTKVKPRVLN